ncbi:restriction endonuclease subunit S [Tenacibaculum maritimum]|uniref:restriction endonuclease subunit S n=1 Tax=Tenacibaculum maritimum TaxID=107401 RepID=UPI0038775F20
MELTTKQGFKQTEIGLIPEDWLVISLSEAVEFLDGKRRPIKANERVSGNYPYYGASGIIDYVNDYIFDDELILLGEDGENILSRNLPLAFIIKGKAWVNNHAHVMKPNKFFNINFLTEYLESLDYSLLNSGTAQPKLNKKSCLNIRVIAPPIKEQKAIATALSDVDDLIASLEGLIAKKQAIKQGAMQQLLTPPHKGGKRLPGFSGDWVEKTIEELSKTFTKQTGFDYSNHIKPILLDKVQRNTYPFIQNKDFDGYNINFDTDYYIPCEVAEKFPRILLNEKCLLISISGSIGKVGVFNNKQTAFIGGAVAVGKFLEKDLLDWVMLYLKSEAGQNLMLKDVKAGSHQNLILDDIRKMKIPIPPKNEQIEVCGILKDIQKDIERLETKKAKYQQLKQGMLQELLTGNTRLV